MQERISSGSVEPEATMRATPAGPPERRFVGRRDELALLRAGIEATTAGSGSFFLLSGEAGVGKTRLASEFAEEATGRGLTVVWGRCWEAGGAPSYWPWIEVIRKLIGDEETVDVGARGRFLAQLVPDLATRLGAAGVDALSPADPESARFLMFDAVWALLRHRTRQAPLLVVLDDLHRGDRASLLLLSFIVRHSADVPLLLVGTTRDGDADVDANLREPLAEVSRRATRIELGGLTKHDITSLLDSSSDAHEDLAKRIHDATDGNAFFVDEVLRSLAAGDAVSQSRTAPVELRVPSGVRDAVRLRLASLSPANVAVLETAAVVGREFEASIVARALADEPATVLAALETPVKIGILAASAGRPGCFQFRHALIRDALYDALPAARRLALHQKIAEAFESLAEVAPDRYLGELAHHFLIAAAYGDARFIAHVTRAARRALSSMAFEEAATLYQRAIDALIHVDSNDRQYCELLLALAEAKEWNNEAAASREAFEQAAEIARRLDATDLFVRAALGVGAVAARKFNATSRYESAPLLILEGLKKLGTAASGSRALMLSRLALHHLTNGERDDAHRLSKDAVDLARQSGDRGALGEALTVRHAALLGPDAMEERHAIADELLALGNELLRVDLVLRGHGLRFMVRFECGDIRAADHDLEQHRRLAEALSDPFDRWANLVWQAARVLLEGRFNEADAYARRAMDLTERVPGLHSADINGPSVFAAHTILVADTATRDLPADLVRVAYEGRFPEISAWRTTALLAYLRARDTAAVIAELDQLAVHAFEDFERNMVWLGTISAVAEAAAFAGDRVRAKLLYAMLLPYAEFHGTFALVASFGSVARYLGLLAATLERWEDAERHFLAATEINRSMGASPHVAKTLFDHGRLLFGRRDAAAPERGVDLVRRARAIAARLEMPGLLRDCDALLDGATDVGGQRSERDAEYALARQGEVWILRHDGRQTPLRHSKGVAYIAELLRHPNREILAIDLLTSLAAEPGSAAPQLATQNPVGGVGRQRGHFVDRVFDARARQAYEARVDDLERELSRAEADGDPERVLDLRDELSLVERELTRGVGLGGRSRQISDVERARVSVTRAIRLALGRMADVAPTAAGTLARRIRTGTYCCYLVSGRSSDSAP
jgi:tetratricopeptide (TPR) repeat protein